MRIARLCTITGALVALVAAPALAVQGTAPTEGATVTDRSYTPSVTSLVPLPGERRARELSGGAVSRRGTVHGCRYRQFCTYTGDDFIGMLDRMQSCTLHITHGLFRSYVNNQTRGTRARFYLANMERLSSTKPAPAKGTTSLGLTTYYIRPC